MEGVQISVVENGELFERVRTAQIGASFKNESVTTSVGEEDDFGVAPGDLHLGDAGEDLGDGVEGREFVHGAKIVRDDQAEPAHFARLDQLPQGLGIFSRERESADLQMRTRSCNAQERGQGIAQDEIPAKDGVNDFTGRGKLLAKSSGVFGAHKPLHTTTAGQLVGAALVFVKTIFRDGKGLLFPIGDPRLHGSDGIFKTTSSDSFSHCLGALSKCHCVFQVRSRKQANRRLF